jgi:hypothetical protein
VLTPIVLAERKTGKPGHALAEGAGLSVDTLFKVKYIFNTFLANSNNK